MARAPEVFTIDYVPLPQVVADKYYMVADLISEFREPLTRCVRDVLTPSIRENFETYGHGSWQSLAADTIVDRVEKGFSPGPILVRSGLLKRTATSMSIWNIDGYKAYVNGSSFQGAWYGLAQNAGYTGGYGAETPARPFLTFSLEDEVAMLDIFIAWLDEKMLEAGFKVGGVSI